MLWSVRTLGYFGLLGAGEFLVSGLLYDSTKHLSLSYISVENTISPPFFIINLQTSKTIHFNFGVQVYLNVCSVLYEESIRQKTLTPNNVTPCTSQDMVKYFQKILFSSNLKLLLSPAGMDPSQYTGHLLQDSVTMLHSPICPISR